MKRRFREPCFSRRDERAAAVASPSASAPVVPGRSDGAPESCALAGVFVAEAASEGGGRVVNHAEKTVGELVEAEVDVAAGVGVV